MNNNLVFYDNYPCIAYSPSGGYLCRVSKEGEFIRKLIPSPTGMINVFVADKGSFTNRKAVNVAYEILNKGPIPEGYLVYHKDADESNIKANNIALIYKQDYVTYKDAIDNIINDRLRLYYSKGLHCVRYKYMGRTKVKKFDDLVSASAFRKDIYLESIKLIGRFYING